MKKTILFSCLLALICGIGSCSKTDTSYPATTLLGERTCTGKIVSLPTPPTSIPPIPGVVLGLETASENYVLTHNWDWQTDGAAYALEEGDHVEVTGTASMTQLSASQSYFELDIKSVTRLDPTN